MEGKYLYNGDVVHGVVKWFQDGKGYGFITVGTQDAFAHFSQIQAEGFKSLVQGQRVTCQLIETNKGISAHNIVVEA